MAGQSTLVIVMQDVYDVNTLPESSSVDIGEKPPYTNCVAIVHNEGVEDTPLRGTSMARKKTEPTPMPATAEPKTKAIRLELTEADQDELRVIAAKAKKSMAAYVRELVLKTIEAERKGR